MPGFENIIGTATNAATVTLNWTQTSRKGDYYRTELSVNNTNAPVWLGVTNLGVLQQGTNADLVITNIGHLYVPKTPESFAFDADGNMTSDGRWTNRWDAENRLIEQETISSAVSAGAPHQKLIHEYDWMERRVRKAISNWNGSAWILVSDLQFIYQGWNLVAILDGTTSTLLYSFVWGTDLSGSMQGAGGVGGLLMMFVHTGTNAGMYFFCYDGNGNVVALVNSATGAVVAEYEYGPFGELLRATGPLAFVNPFRFSTKYQDDETGLLYYGYRFYDPHIGRWLSRDPKDDLGFTMAVGGGGGIPAKANGDPNEYLFVMNSPIQRVDTNGLDSIDVTYANGATASFSSPTLNDFLSALATAVRNNNPITGITIKGHANSTLQSAGDAVITISTTGTQILVGNGIDIRGLLNQALATNGWVYLAGCGTARGPSNISQQMSTLLPNRTVYGHGGVYALNVPYCACAVGKRIYYINGLRVNSGW